MPLTKKSSRIVGWREWISLPELKVDRIKAKIDTGARTSALHAFALEPFREHGESKIRFALHPLQNQANPAVYCVAPLADERWVTDSGGHKEYRPVIVTPVTVGDASWPIELTLAARDTMLFRMLLGRTAMRARLLVDPGRSFLVSQQRGEAANTDFDEDIDS